MELVAHEAFDNEGSQRAKFILLNCYNGLDCKILVLDDGATFISKQLVTLLLALVQNSPCFLLSLLYNVKQFPIQEEKNVLICTSVV